MKKLMVLALSFGLVLLGTAPAMAAAGDEDVLLPLEQQALDEDSLSEIVGSESLFHAGMAEVLSEGPGGGGGGGGGGAAIAYGVGRAAYSVGRHIVKAYRAVDKAIDRATKPFVKNVGRFVVVKKVVDWFRRDSTGHRRNNDDRY